MKNFLNRNEDPFDFLAEAIIYHANVLAGRRGITKQDLVTLELNLKSYINMKVSELKVALDEVRADLAEARGELADVVSRLDQAIEQLQDPTITDETLLATLQGIREDAAALANIVEDSEPSTDTGGGPSPTV